MTARRPDLAMFLPTLGGGGAERVMIDLARHAAARGRAVDVVVLNHSGAVTSDLGPGVTIVDLGRRRAATALPALLSYLRRARPPALLSTLEHVNVLAVVAARLVGGIRVVLREANTFGSDLNGGGAKGWFVRTAMRWTYRAADAVVAVSSGVADGLVTGLGVPAERVHVIYNPVITPRVLEGAKAMPEHSWFEGDGPPVIVAVGRLAEQKGFDVLLRAFTAVRAGRPCRLLVLGEGPLRDELSEAARKLGIESDVAFPGFVANPFGYMAHAELFVLSSRWEGLPNVLIQALAVGAPAVATDCPSGPREILDGGRFGRLVPVDDAPALAAAIEAELDARSERPGDAWHRRYALDAIASEYLELLAPSPPAGGAGGRT